MVAASVGMIFRAGLVLEECAPVGLDATCTGHVSFLDAVDYYQFPVDNAMLTDTAVMCSIIIIIDEGPFGGDDYWRRDGFASE